MKRNIRMIIEYDGARYHGWQRLGKNAESTTIQGKIESVLSKMAGEEIQIVGSGRTDAGVNAYGQVTNFHTECEMPLNEIKDYLQKYLPTDIGVKMVEEASFRFHSRLNAVNKTYCYKLGIPGKPNVFARKYTWNYPDSLNIALMEKAATYLLGAHDFIGFSSLKKSKKSTTRTINEIRFERTENEINIYYNGNGFLHNMVRILTGTLVEIGAGKKQPEDILKVFKTNNREFAGITAPPQGLFLVKVFY